MTLKKVLALDYGSGSMRGVTGKYDGKSIAFQEVARAGTERVARDGNLYWDTGAMQRLAERSIGAAQDVSSVGIDTWGADFGLIGKDRKMISLPLSYRDPKVQGSAREVFDKIPPFELYQSNGTIIEDICPLVHLNYWKTHMPSLLEKAEGLQMMANLICFLLTGEKTFDNTLASPSGMYDLNADTWNAEVLKRLALPDILPETKRRENILAYAEGSNRRIPIMRICGHDTSSALMAVPAKKRDHILYVSTGSWVMTGCFLKEPVITRETYEAGLSNENGFDGEINFLRYSNGLYIVQECAKEWLEQENWTMDYSLIEEQAFFSGYEGAIDPDSAEFTHPGRMCEKINAFLKKTGQDITHSRAEVYAAILNGIADKAARTAADISRVLKKSFEAVYVLGGGAQSAYLCEAIKKKTGLRLFAGPVEATAAGNICTQLLRQKEISNLTEAAEVLRNSAKIKEF